MFPTSEASISSLGRKAFSPDLKAVSNVNELVPLASVLAYLGKSNKILKKKNHNKISAQVHF